jgi:hypothetical protein
MKLTTDNANKILALYDKRVFHIIKPLGEQDRQDIKMELDSHIYESMARNPKEDEVTTLLSALEKLGEPETFLYDVVAERKLNQARKSFNFLHVISALGLNIGRGVIKTVLFFIITIVYIVSFSCAAVAVVKIFIPSKVGMHVYPGGFTAGWIEPHTPGAREVLGLWFTPVFIILAVLLYVINTFLLRLIPKKTTTI